MTNKMYYEANFDAFNSTWMKVHLDKKFFSAWLGCALLMFAISYLWHGYFLFDLKKLSYPKDAYLAISGIVYLGLGLLITIVTVVSERIRTSWKYGFLLGVFMGGFFYLFAFMLGLSFSTEPRLEVLLFDLVWQICEQTAGALVAGIIFRAVYRYEHRLSMLKP